MVIYMTRNNKKDKLRIWYHPEYNEGHPVLYYHDMETAHVIDMKNGGSKALKTITVCEVTLPEPMTKNQYEKFLDTDRGVVWAEDALMQGLEALKENAPEHYNSLDTVV